MTKFGDKTVLHVHVQVTKSFSQPLYCFISADLEYSQLCIHRERGGVVVERRTPNGEVLGSIPTGVIVLCP